MRQIVSFLKKWISIITSLSANLQRHFKVGAFRCLVGSTDQACSSGFYFRIAWKSTEWPCFLQNHSFSFLQGLRSLKNWLLQKLSMKSLEQKFWFLTEKWIFWCPNISRIKFVLGQEVLRLYFKYSKIFFLYGLLCSFSLTHSKCSLGAYTI